LNAASGKERRIAPDHASQIGTTHSLLWAPLLAIASAAFAIEIPFLFFGTPSGHDVEFHLYSWLEVLSAWKHGVWLPRWAAMANFGYGEPRFIFYPPASWTLGAIISAVVPWRFGSPVYIWLALVLAGSSMFVLVRRWLPRTDAIFAAVLYAVNPYHLIIVYWRSAFAELLASCLVPLLFLFVLKAADGERRAWLAISLVLAGAWLTNAPAAVMIHYSLAPLILFFAWQRRSPKLLLVGAGAVLLGACLAAFYLVPAIYEQKWVNIGEAISVGSRPQDNFLFIHTTDRDHDAFNRIVSWIAVLEIAATFIAAWAARRWRKSRPELWNGFVAWAAVCSVAMFPVTAILWKYLPKLEFMQFPWRWLLCLSLLFALLVTIGFRRWWMRASICALAVVVIALAWVRIQEPWWDNRADLKEMQDNMTDQIGYEGTDEYTPVGADPSAIDKTAWKVRVDGTAHAAIHVYKWDPESKYFTADMSSRDLLALKLFAYPAWRVEVNGRTVQTAQRESTGQILVPVEAGMNRVQITFARTWDRKLGGWISLITAIFLAVFIIRHKTSRI
jgi:hypothetical protein